MTDRFNFEGPSEGKGKLPSFPKLRQKEIIARIRLIRERRPQFHRGNQYREALNVICGAGIDHAKGLNAEILNLALGFTTLPPGLEKSVQEIMPAVRGAFDRALNEWREEKAEDLHGNQGEVVE